MTAPNSRLPRPSTAPSKPTVRAVPDFAKLHQKWETKLSNAKAKQTKVVTVPKEFQFNTSAKNNVPANTSKTLGVKSPPTNNSSARSSVTVVVKPSSTTTTTATAKVSQQSKVTSSSTTIIKPKVVSKPAPQQPQHSSTFDSRSMTAPKSTYTNTTLRKPTINTNPTTSKPASIPSIPSRPIPTARPRSRSALSNYPSSQYTQPEIEFEADEDALEDILNSDVSDQIDTRHHTRRTTFLASASSNADILRRLSTVPGASLRRATGGMGMRGRQQQPQQQKQQQQYQYQQKQQQYEYESKPAAPAISNKRASIFAGALRVLKKAPAPATTVVEDAPTRPAFTTRMVNPSHTQQPSQQVAVSVSTAAHPLPPQQSQQSQQLQQQQQQQQQQQHQAMFSKLNQSMADYALRRQNQTSLTTPLKKSASTATGSTAFTPGGAASKMTARKLGLVMAEMKGLTPLPFSVRTGASANIVRTNFDDEEDEEYEDENGMQGTGMIDSPFVHSPSNYHSTNTFARSLSTQQQLQSRQVVNKLAINTPSRPVLPNPFEVLGIPESRGIIAPAAETGDAVEEEEQETFSTPTIQHQRDFFTGSGSKSHTPQDDLQDQLRLLREQEAKLMRELGFEEEVQQGVDGGVEDELDNRLKALGLGSLVAMTKGI